MPGVYVARERPVVVLSIPRDIQRSAPAGRCVCECFNGIFHRRADASGFGRFRTPPGPQAIGRGAEIRFGFDQGPWQDLALVARGRPLEDRKGDRAFREGEERLGHRRIGQRRRDATELHRVFKLINRTGDIERQQKRLAAVGRCRQRDQCKTGGKSERPHQCPVFSMLAQGSCGGSASPRCSSSTETLSGERTKAM